MKPGQLATLLSVSGETVRRWTGIFGPFLSPGATPPKGKPRHLSAQDMRVLLLVASLRNIGQEIGDITDRLEAERENDWKGLPDLPPDWGAVTGPSMPVELAASRAHELAQVAALQTQVQHLQDALTTERRRTTRLEAELDALRSDLNAASEVKTKLQLELERSRAEVARLEGRLDSYTLGTKKPVNAVLFFMLAALIGALFVFAATILLMVLPS